MKYQENLSPITTKENPLDLGNISQNALSEHITPEIASYVVKNYILPMFDSRGKKLMKNNNIQSKSPARNSVLHELKLFDLLENEKSSLSKDLLTC
jgi:hypothetical protein